MRHSPLLGTTDGKPPWFLGGKRINQTLCDHNPARKTVIYDPKARAVIVEPEEGDFRIDILIGSSEYIKRWQRAGFVSALSLSEVKDLLDALDCETCGERIRQAWKEAHTP